MECLASSFRKLFNWNYVLEAVKAHCVRMNFRNNFPLGKVHRSQNSMNVGVVKVKVEDFLYFNVSLSRVFFSTKNETETMIIESINF